VQLGDALGGRDEQGLAAAEVIRGGPGRQAAAFSAARSTRAGPR
jgi:hypothetical protein